MPLPLELKEGSSQQSSRKRKRYIFDEKIAERQKVIENMSKSSDEYFKTISNDPLYQCFQKFVISLNRVERPESEYNANAIELTYREVLRSCNISTKKKNDLVQFKLKYISDQYKNEIARLDQFAENYTNMIFESCEGTDKLQIIQKKDIESKVQEIFSQIKEALNKKYLMLMKQTWETYRNYSKKESTRKSFSSKVTTILTDWFHDHQYNPYPINSEKERLAFLCDLDPKQVRTWFGNYRGRYKKKVEEQISSTQKMLKNLEC